MLNYSKNESDVFGYNIFRYSGKELPEIEELLSQIIENKADVVIMRVPASCQNGLSVLNQLGFNYYLADTLVEYTFKISSNYSPARLDIGYKIEYEIVESKEKLELTKNILKTVFKNYSNHYNSNPILKNDYSLEIYLKWLDECFGNKGVIFLAKCNNEFAGFFSGIINNGIFVGGPGGVLPDFEGCGIYYDAHQYLPSILKSDFNINKCRSGTQIQNHVVQKQWALLNWSLTYSWLTIHLNALLNNSLLSGYQKIRIDSDKISNSSIIDYFNSQFFTNYIIVKQQLYYNNTFIQDAVFYTISEFIPDEKIHGLYHVQINLFDCDYKNLSFISTLIR